MSDLAAAATKWASENALIRWVNDAPDGPMTEAELINEYLGEVNPFVDGARVEVQDRDDPETWSPAVVVERAAHDEWTVELDDGDQVWRDHTELRLQHD